MNPMTMVLVSTTMTTVNTIKVYIIHCWQSISFFFRHTSEKKWKLRIYIRMMCSWFSRSPPLCVCVLANNFFFFFCVFFSFYSVCFVWLGVEIYKLDSRYASFIQIYTERGRERENLSLCISCQKYEAMEKRKPNRRMRMRERKKGRIRRGNIENEISWFSTFHTDIDLFS